MGILAQAHSGPHMTLPICRNNSLSHLPMLYPLHFLTSWCSLLCRIAERVHVPRQISQSISFPPPAFYILPFFFFLFFFPHYPHFIYLSIQFFFDTIFSSSSSLSYMSCLHIYCIQRVSFILF